MMRAPFKSLSRQVSKTNSATILVFCAVLVVLGTCGVWYWRHVETQTLLIQERNFRALTVTSHALREMVTNYESVFKSVIDGEPPCTKSPCQEEDRRTAYENALRELPAFEEPQASNAVPAFKDVKVTKEPYEDEGFAVKFTYQDGKCSIKLTYVHQDRVEPIKTRWKITAVMDIRPVMRQLVTEDIFSDVVLADRTGRVLYHHPSTHDPSGFEFEDIAALLRRLNGFESKESGDEKHRLGKNDDLVSTLPLFNEAPIGGIAHAIFAQATDFPADRGTVQTLILVGIVPAGQFHAESRAIALNVLLVMVGLTLAVCFVLPYVKLRTNAPTERLTPISVAVVIISTLLGTAVLTFGLVDFATYRNLEQHLNTRLKDVSDEIRKQFNGDVQRGLNQLLAFDRSCNSLECWRRLRTHTLEPHLAQRLCIGKSDGGKDNEFVFTPAASNDCSKTIHTISATQVVHREVESMFWVGSTGEFRVFLSRDPFPWKYVDVKERQYVRRILADETLIRRNDETKFWIQPIYSRTNGDNAAVLSMKSWLSPEERSPNGPIVAALEVKLPSVMHVGVPPGMGFAVITQEGEVLFHSDARRNLRENLFEETDRDGHLRQAVFAHATTQFDGRYWGKDRHFNVTPVFPAMIAEPHIGPSIGPITESPDVHWSLVTYWDIDMLRGLNLRALYSSGALFFIYALIALSIVIGGWWVYSRANEAAYRWVWPQSEQLHHYQIAIALFVVSLVAVGIWYVRPYPAPDMLLWALLPALAAIVVVLSITHPNADSTNKAKPDTSIRRRYRRSYALLVTVGLLTFVVIPALVIFRVAMDVEWRLLAKFALFDLEQDSELQAQRVRKAYLSELFHDPHGKGEVRTTFLEKFSGQNVVYADFPFESCGKEKNKPQASEHCHEFTPIGTVQRDDERLIRWLHQVIDRPHIGQRGVETDILLEEPDRWHESEWGTLWLRGKSQATNLPPISLQPILSPVPQWFYFLLVFGSLAPLVALQVEKTYLFAAAIAVVGGFLWFGLVGEGLAVLGVLAVNTLLYGAYCALPRFAAQRVTLLDFPHPSIGSTAIDRWQGIAKVMKVVKEGQAPRPWPLGLSNVFSKEMSGVLHVRSAEIDGADELERSCQKIWMQDFEDDFDIAKERLIREFLEAATKQYMQIWEKCTESQRGSLFNLARDGFLHTRNPDIDALLKNGLIIGDLNVRPMNESFRRFIIKTGSKERPDEDIAQERTSTWWSQVWRPIGVGLLFIMVFLILTQEQYRTITLAFLGVLPGLLGAFSQVLTAPRKEKLETASSV